MNENIIKALVLFCAGIGFFSVLTFVIFLALEILHEENEKNNKHKH